jgi:hypothetical protein
MIMTSLKIWNQFYNLGKAQKILVEVDKIKKWRKEEPVETIIQIWIYKTKKIHKIKTFIKAFKTFNRINMMQ